MSKKSRTTRPALPAPLEVGVIDNHTHFNIHLDELEGVLDPLDLGDALQLAAQAGVRGAVQVAVDLETAEWTDRVTREYENLVGAIALHPNEAPAVVQRGELDAQLARLRQIAQENPKIRAIGETGLDYFRTESALQTHQQEAFRKHIALAKDLGIALQIHDRDAHNDIVRILREEGAPEYTVFHCFSGGPELAKICADEGWYTSFAGTVTFKNAQELRDALLVLPPELLLVETDAPFLTPVPERGRINSSYLLPHTVRSMAEVLSMPVAELCEQLNATTEKVYGQWPLAPQVEGSNAP